MRGLRMKTAIGRSFAFVLFLLASSSNVFSGSMGNGAAQRQAAAQHQTTANGQNTAPAPAQNPAAANSQSAAAVPAQSGAAIPGLNAPVPAGAIMLDAVPLGSVTGTGGGHYNPLPVITNGGARTLVVVPNGSRVQAYVDGVAGPVVNAIPVTQAQTQAQLGGCTNGSPQFSADQKRVAYIVDLDNNKHAVVVDGTMSPAYDRVSWLSFAPVGHHFAYLVQRALGPNGTKGNEFFVVDDGRAGKVYSQGCGPAIFSPDGNRVAFVGSVFSKGLTPIEVQQGKKTPQNVCVVLDGVEQTHFAKIDQPIFSQDSKHLAYLAGIDQLSVTRAVVDNKEGPAYPAGVKDLVVSDDGSRSAYIATKTIVQQGAPSQPIYFVVDSGKEGAPYDLQISHLCVSHDGQHVAYVAQGMQTHTVVVADGKPSQQYQGCDTLKFSPDSKTMLYIATTAQGTFVVVNGKEYGPFSNVNSEPAFSDQGGHWACCVTTGEQKFAILSDDKMIALDRIAPGKLAYQPGSGELTMRTTTSTSGMPVTFEVKGDTISGADVPNAIAYSPNHQHFVKVITSDYGTSQVKQKFAIDEQPPSDAKYADIKNIAVSDDGKHVAFIGSYTGENGKASIHAVYDGTEGPGYWGIQDIALSPDGSHVAYVAQKSNPRGLDTFVVIDGVEGPAFQDVLIDGAYSGQGMGAHDQYHQVSFAADGSLHFLPVINGQLYRCSYPAEAFKGLPSLAAHEAEKPGPRDIHDFKRPNIFEDQAQVMSFALAPDETIYGVSIADGKFKKGTLFKVKTDGSGFADLHDFYGGDNDGEKPMSIVLAPDGTLYGTLERKMFHYDPKSQQYALVDLKSQEAPGSLVGSGADGTLLGFDERNVVSMAPDGSNYIKLQNGQFGKPLLLYSQIIPAKDGTFFAISTALKGSLVKFKTLKETPAVVHKFVDSPTDGNRPDPDLVLDNKGNLYGTTSAGGMSQKGVIYKLDADGTNYQVVYNPDDFAFTPTFVAGDDGMLYGLSKDGLLQLVPDGANKPPTTLIAFDASNYHNHRSKTNILFHDGAIYGLHEAAIYKLTLPKAGAGVASTANPTVAIKTIQPQPLASEAITITDPSGAASAGAASADTAAGNATPAGSTTAAQPTNQTQSAATQPTPDTITQTVNKVNKKKNSVDKAVKKGLGGLLGH
jgi:uncharacterized repeat protein (TIGR03803 family)